MNKIKYKLSRKFGGRPTLDVGRVDTIYDHYIYFCDYSNTPVIIGIDNFETILKTTYSVLGIAISEDEFAFLTDQVLKKLIEDARDGKKVNTKWFINHIWYYVTALRGYVDTNAYANLIPIAQDELYYKYRIKETTTKKLKRKFNTYMKCR